MTWDPISPKASRHQMISKVRSDGDMVDSCKHDKIPIQLPI